jgi:translocation and assembly module TamB
MRVLRWAGIGLAAIAALLLALIWLADTDIGHRFIIDRIAAQQPKSGLRISIGRIDGSIYGKATLRQVRLSDPKGVFFVTSEARLDWTPWRWVSANALDIDELVLPQATLFRLPKLNPGDPDADIKAR